MQVGVRQAEPGCPPAQAASIKRLQVQGVRFWFPDGQMGGWACLGAVTSRSVRVWLRDPEAQPRVARLTVDGGPAAEAELRPQPEHDFVAAAEVTLPRPAPGGRFTVQVDGLTRTGCLAPIDGQATSFAFAFGSCHEPFLPAPKHSGPLRVQPSAGIYPRMAEVLREREARFLLLLGDQIYSDDVPWISVRERLKRAYQRPGGEALTDIYRELYRGYLYQSGFRALLEGWPSYLMWDDHEIYDNAGSLLKHEVDPYDRALFDAAETSFCEYQHLHNPGASLTDRRPYHYTFWYGDTGFFVFDLRGDRDYVSGVLLSPQQRADFQAFLREADTRGVGTVFIGATIPLVHYSSFLVRATEWVPGRKGGDVRDRWAVRAYRPVRDEVLEALFAWQSARPHRQAIILSGDVHSGTAFRLARRSGGGVLRQWTSSPLSTPAGLPNAVANWIGTKLVNWGEGDLRAERQALVLNDGNFGLVEVQALPTGGHEVSLSLFAYSSLSHRLRRAARVVARPGS